jgi:hypothetical protein
VPLPASSPPPLTLTPLIPDPPPGTKFPFSYFSFVSFFSICDKADLTGQGWQAVSRGGMDQCSLLHTREARWHPAGQ